MKYIFLIICGVFSLQLNSQSNLATIEASLVQSMTNTDEFDVVFTPNADINGVELSSAKIWLKVPDGAIPTAATIVNAGDFIFELTSGPDSFGGSSYYQYSGTQASVVNWTSGTPQTIATFEYSGTENVVDLSGGDVGLVPSGSGPNASWNGTSIKQTGSGDNFVAWPISSQISLPITISQFSATKLTERSAKLTWETSLEINSDYFIIQRSSDAHNWENVGSVDAAGNSTIAQSYDFIDSTIPTTLREDNSTYFYRLAMVDLDERFDLSEIRTVAFDPNVSAINVYPNPTAQNIIIDLTSIEGASTVQLIDITGKLIYEQKVTDEYNSIPVLNLQQMGLDNGTYLVRITETLSKKVHTKKVLFID